MMFPGMRANRWYHLIILLIGLVLLGSCVSSTLNETRSTPAAAAHGYSEIKAIIEKLSESDEPAGYETLIEKSRVFIKTHPKYRQVDEIYFYLGAILVQMQRTDEGIAVLEELIKDYPSAIWATWCQPCIAEMPNVKRTYEKHKNRNFQIIGISLDTAMEPLDAYVKGEGIAWRQYWDRSGQISTLYNVQAIPSTFLIDGAGTVRRVNLRGPALENAVDELVQENLSN